MIKHLELIREKCMEAKWGDYYLDVVDTDERRAYTPRLADVLLAIREFVVEDNGAPQDELIYSRWNLWLVRSWKGHGYGSQTGYAFTDALALICGNCLEVKSLPLPN